MMERVVTTLAWSCMFSLVATLAFAQDGSRVERARTLFKEGTSHAAEDRWQQALQAFERSSELLGHASTTYNVGYCERGLGHPTRARMFFVRALEEHQARGDELTSDQQAAAKAYIAEAEAHIAVVTVTLEPATASVSVDGRPLVSRGDHHVAGIAPLGAPAPTSSPIKVHIDPGRHVFEVTDGEHTDKHVVEVVRGEHRALTIGVGEATPPAPDPEPGAPEDDNGRTTQLGWAIGLGGAGVVLGGVAAVMSVVSANTWEDAQAACPQTTRCPDDQGFELSHRAGFEARLATAALVTAGAALAGGLVLWFTAPSAVDEPITVGVSLGGVGVRGTF